VPRAGDDLRTNVTNRLGAKFRALAGGTPANPPKPAAQPGRLRLRKADAGPSLPPLRRHGRAGCTRSDRHRHDGTGVGEFSSNADAAAWKVGPVAIEKGGSGVLADLFPGKQPAQLAPADWGRMLAEGPGKIIPF